MCDPKIIEALGAMRAVAQAQAARARLLAAGEEYRDALRRASRDSGVQWRELSRALGVPTATINRQARGAPITVPSPQPPSTPGRVDGS